MPAGSLSEWSYEPGDQPGALTFYDRDEKPLTLFGPPAQEFAQRIDRTKAAIEASTDVAPQPVAGPGGGAKEDIWYDDPVAPVDRATGRALPPTAAAIPSNTHAARPAAGAGVFDLGTAPPALASGPTVNAVSETARAAPPMRTAPQTATEKQAEKLGLQPVGYGSYRGADGQLYRYRGGSARVTKADLQEQAANRVAIPTSQSLTVSGGFPGDPDYIEGIRERSIDRRLQLDQAREIQAENAELERQIAADNFTLRARQLEQEQNRQAEIQARIAKDQALADQARQEYNSAKVDPQRLFHGKNGGGTALVSGIAAAMGAFGAALTKTPNFALDIINNSIDRDIRAQEAEIAVKKDGANNALAQLQRSGLDGEQSKLLLRQLQTEYALTKADSIRATAKNSEVDARFAALNTGLQESLAEQLEAYRQATIGKATTSTAAAMASPRAGSAGGFAPIGTPQQQVAFASSVQGLQAGEANIGATEARTAAQLQKLEAKANIGKDGKAVISRGLQNRYVSADTALQGLDTLAAAAGLKADKSGSYTESTWDAYKQHYSNKVMNPIQSGAKFQAAKETAAAETLKVLTGGMATEAMFKNLMEELDHMSPPQLANWINIHRHGVESTKKGIEKVSLGAHELDMDEDHGDSEGGDLKAGGH